MLIGFSPDPYLTGVAMEETIVAMQKSGVQANAKRKSSKIGQQ
jgi:beta-glucosidase